MYGGIDTLSRPCGMFLDYIVAQWVSNILRFVTIHHPILLARRLDCHREQFYRRVLLVSNNSALSSALRVRYSPPYFASW